MNNYIYPNPNDDIDYEKQQAVWKIRAGRFHLLSLMLNHWASPRGCPLSAKRVPYIRNDPTPFPFPFPTAIPFHSNPIPSPYAIAILG
jgi:hypothetical protein